MVGLLEPSRDFKNIFEDMEDKGSGIESLDSFRANQVLLLQASQTGGDISAVDNTAVKQAIKQQGLSSVSRDAITNRNRDLVAEVTSLLASSEAEEEDAGPATEDLEQRVVESDAKGLTVAVVDELVTNSLAEISDADIQREVAESANRVSENLAFLSFAAQRIAEVSKTDGVLDTAANIGGLFIPGRTVQDTLELGDIAKEIPGLNANTLIQSFAGLSVEEKYDKLEDVIKAVDEITDNKILKAGILQKIVGFDNSDFDFDFYLDIALTGADALGVGAAVGGGKVLKSLNSVKLLGDTGNTKVAGKITAGSLVDPDVARASGLDTATAQANAVPFEMERVFPGSTDNIAGETVEEVEKIVREVDRLTKEAEFTGTSLFSSAERAAAKGRFLDEYAEELNRVNGGISHTGVASKAEAKVVKERFSDFDVEVRGAGGQFETRNVRVIKSDVGVFNATETGALSSVSRFVATPSTILINISKNLVSRATQVARESAKNIDRLTRAAVAADKGLKKKSIAKVDDILLAGDRLGEADGVVYSLQQLTSEGIPTEKGMVRLNTREAASYYAKRQIFDRLFEIENSILRRDLEFEGYKALDINPSTGEASNFLAHAKPVDQFEPGTTRVFRSDTGKVVDVNDPAIEAALESGSLERHVLRDPVKISINAAERELFDSVLVPKGGTKPLPDYVLNKRTGYVPADRINVNYVVREEFDTTVSGKPRKVFSTERLFNTRLDAEKWVAERPDRNLVVNSNRQVQADGNAAEEIRNLSHGGLYGGPRTQRELLFGLEGNTPVRRSATEAMLRNLVHAGNKATLNEFRLSTTQKFKNTFGQFLLEPENPLTSPISSAANLTPKQRIALQETQMYIRNIVGIPSPDEITWGALTNQVASWVEGKPFLARIGSKVTRAEDAESFITNIHDLGAKDPTAVIRGGAFHTLLGAYNTSQSFIQSMGALPAISMNPAVAPKLIGQFMGLRMAMHYRKVGNLAAVNTVVKRFQPASGMSKKDYLELVEQFNRTGIIDSVKTSADYDAVLNSFNVDRSVFGKIWDNGLVFFREGEGFARTYSWLFARDEYIKQTGKKVLNDLDLDKIAKRALDVGLNLDAANAARWQKGIIGVPLQFFQIFTKFGEQMLGKSITTGDKLRIFAGQLALVGPNAVPWGREGTQRSLEALGVELGDMSKEQQAAIEDGLIGLGLYYLTGERVSIKTRASLVSGITEQFEKFNEDDARFWDIFLGATSSVSDKAVKALRNTATIFAPVYEDFSNFEPSLLLDAASELATVTSSWSNTLQAYYIINSQRVTDSKGNTLWRFDPDDPRLIPTAIVEALGFTVSRQNAIFEAQKDLRISSNEEKQVVEALVFAFRKYAESENLEEQEKFARIWNTMLIRPFETQPEVASRIMNSFKNRVLGPGKERQVFDRLLNRSVEGIVVPSTFLAPQLSEDELSLGQ